MLQFEYHRHMDFGNVFSTVYAMRMCSSIVYVMDVCFQVFACVFKCLRKCIFQMFMSWKCIFQVPIKCVQQKLYVRISAHIYNELAEYQLLADAILQLTKDCDKTL